MPLPKAPAGAANGVAAEMAGPAPCGGCGAKLASGALAGVLAHAHGASRGDVTSVVGDDAAVLLIGDARQVISTDHLRGFALDPALVAKAAAVHALGDIWAMGAAPQAALAQIILPRMEARLQGKWLNEVMQAAGGIFEAEGVAVVGGHSSGGTELTVGFTVTGLLDRDPITLEGAQPGDALILTKPIGTGVILAAEMQSKAYGEDVLACWQAMATPSGAAAKALAPIAHAMTDVTGFGLAGHLGNVCTASGVGANIALDAVPLLNGAKTLAGQGIRSSLWAQNRASVHCEAPDTALADLMFDPQTAGGLLACVPAALAETIPGAIRIGEITQDPGLRFA